jgi:hypothetical protein
MAEPGRRGWPDKPGHDGGGRLINRYRYKRPHCLADIQNLCYDHSYWPERGSEFGASHGGGMEVVDNLKRGVGDFLLFSLVTH